ncbi:tRNA (adenosine(37)-N6)-threonylcarbamoyltransferase complex ATPase subunit type 1 TsaE [Acetobacter sp.]|uniref:tRNA (adenosine(37)-N6)-threonylcarbamoyltransferase complex ATPase subunit type 1 TsaE n=1 Tax=Acetobacter sp. TaxID=440 RepID=UPI0039E7CE93
MTPRMLRLETRTDTEALARKVAAHARPGDTILLSGPLGAGKSVFARAFLRTVCDDPALDVPSPTFTLIQTYDSPVGPVSHFDLWRLKGPEALEELGWDDARTGIILAEWPERLEDLTPEDALHITLKPIPGTGAPDAEDLPREAALMGWSDRL